MSNFLIVGCDGITNLVVDGGSFFLPSGNTYFISFTAETISGCFTSRGVTEEPAVDGVLSVVEHNNCLSCLQDNNFSFFAEDCTNPELDGDDISAYSFTEWPVGQYYKLCQVTEGGLICLCLYIKEVSYQLGSLIPLTGPFTECGCIDPPRSANTESNICLEICTESGTTVTQVSPPHPEWTDGYGVQVTELNMITLGGMNGLNN